MKKFLIGSKAWFSNIPDYNNTFKDVDVDYLYLYDKDDIFIKPVKTIKIDPFAFKKETYYDDLIKNIDKNIYPPNFIGGLLLNNIIEYLNLDLNDIMNKIQPYLKKLGKKHEYIETIYNFYKLNKCAYLSEEQLLEVYNVYKLNKNLINKNKWKI